MNTKGLVSLEYVIILMVLFMIFSLIISLSLDELDIIEESQNRKEARLLCDDVSQTINMVYINGNGYSKQYTLPSKINQKTYIMKINTTGVYVNSHYQLTYSKIIPHNNLLTKNMILESGNTYEFININGFVNITKK